MTLEYTINNMGFLEIEVGVYLSTAEQITAEQEDWFDNDAYKNFNFTSSEYWITTDCGAIPQGVETVQEGILTIYGIEACRRFLGG